jgi:hypothetical protein
MLCSISDIHFNNNIFMWHFEKEKSAREEEDEEIRPFLFYGK